MPKLRCWDASVKRPSFSSHPDSCFHPSGCLDVKRGRSSEVFYICAICANECLIVLALVKRTNGVVKRANDIFHCENACFNRMNNLSNSASAFL